MKPYCVGFAFSPEQDRVILIRKLKPKWQAGRLNGIGGHIEPGEHPLAAMQREAHEEAGLPLNTPWEMFAVLFGPNEEYVMYCFTVRGEFSIVSDGREGDVSVWPVRGLADREDLLPNLRWLVPLARIEETKPGQIVSYPVIVHEQLTEQPRASAFK